MNIFTIVCLCNMELEVEDMGTVECPDCHYTYQNILKAIKYFINLK